MGIDITNRHEVAPIGIETLRRTAQIAGGIMAESYTSLVEMYRVAGQDLQIQQGQQGHAEAAELARIASRDISITATRPAPVEQTLDNGPVAAAQRLVEAAFRKPGA